MKNEFKTAAEARTAANEKLEWWGSNLVWLGVREGTKETGETYFYNAYNVFD